VACESIVLRDGSQRADLDGGEASQFIEDVMTLMKETGFPRELCERYAAAEFLANAES